MTKMYVANATAQDQDFQYTLPGHARPRKQTIPAGGQITVSGDLNTAQIEAIAKHHAQYGFRAQGELARERGVVPLIYNLDRPVPRVIVIDQIKRNAGLMENKGRKMREDAGVVVHQQLETDAQRHGPLKLHELETTIEEMDPKDKAQAEGHDQVHEVTRVTRNEDPKPAERTKTTRAGSANRARPNRKR